MPPAGLCSCPRFMLALFAIGCVNVDASHKRVHLKKKLLCERRPGEADVFLTFEGGPDPADSDLLGVLNKHSAHATFFLVGSSVKRHPDIVRVIDAEGHELAVHGEERVAFAPLDAPSVARYLEDGARSILSVVPSAHLSLMRPLDGSYNPAIDRAGRVLSLRPLLWSCDAQDWKVEPDVGGVSASVVDQINACLAGIFAGMVDGAAGFGAVFRLPSTGAVELVNAILIEASRAGLKAGTCTKLPRASLYEQPEYEPTASASAQPFLRTTPEARVSLNYEPPHSQALGAPATAGSDFKLSLFIVGGSAPRRALLDELLAPLLPALNVSWVVALTPADLTYGPGFLARHAETNKTLACLMSHVEAARALLNSGAQVGLIAEDDVRFHRHAMGRLEALVAWQAAHPDVPMVQVGYLPSVDFRKDFRSRKQQLIMWPAHPQRPYGAVAYLLSREGAADIVRVLGRPGATMQDIRASLLAAGVHVGVRLEADLAVFALFPRAFVRPPVALDAGLPSTRDPNATSLYVREMQAAVSRREISLVDYAGLAFV